MCADQSVSSNLSRPLPSASLPPRPCSGDCVQDAPQETLPPQERPSPAAVQVHGHARRLIGDQLALLLAARTHAVAVARMHCGCRLAGARAPLQPMDNGLASCSSFCNKLKSRKHAPAATKLSTARGKLMGRMHSCFTRAAGWGEAPRRGPRQGPQQAMHKHAAFGIQLFAPVVRQHRTPERAYGGSHTLDESRLVFTGTGSAA